MVRRFAQDSITEIMMKLSFICLSLMLSIVSFAQLQVSSLRVEHMINPAVLDVLHPRISWVNMPSSPTAKGEGQRAYQIQVATTLRALLKGKCDAWDTGKRMGDASYLIPYAGKALRSGQDYWCRVRVWNLKNKVSKWSEPVHWGMGLLNPAEWKARWISAPFDKKAPLLRKKFQINKVVKQAKMFISGLGYFELYMNGERVGDDYLVPNFTNYTSRPGIKTAGIALDDHFRDYRVLYMAYDVTSQLRKGNNVVGVILGNGFYDCACRWVCTFGKPCLLCQLRIEYEDGSEELVVSDTSWKTKPSAILKNGPYEGELYDANAETPSWSVTECDVTDWMPSVAAVKPEGKLSAQSSPSDKITEVLSPVSLKRLADGSYEVDFGKEISGWIRVNGVKAQKGDTLDIKYICESPLGVHRYIFKDSSPVTYAPRFTWYVFSKAVIKGLKHLEASQLCAEAVNTDVPLNAKFHSSNALLNKIVTIWQQSQLDNMHGCIASDCPHRERSPYTGDGQIACDMVMSNFDAAAFYQKWIRDIRDVQNILTGYVPNGAPWQPGCGGGVAWGAAMNVMPWSFYLHYADRQMLEQCYIPMKMQADQMFTWLTPDSTMFQQMANPHSDKPNKWFNLGDWAPAFQLPSAELVHTFFMWLCLDYTSRAARALGKTADVRHYQELANSIKRAFHKKFYDSENKTYGDFGCNVYALRMGVPDDVRQDVINTLRHEIMVKYKGHINTGFVAARFFFEVLVENDMADVAYTVINQTDFPSFGHWIAQGATVTWEQWNGKDSHNHPMFGGGLVWLYRHLAGLQIDEHQPGYKHFFVRPVLIDGLNEVSYSIQSPYGKVSSTIHNNAREAVIDLIVPVGASATVTLPVTHEQKTVPQGHYRFQVSK